LITAALNEIVKLNPAKQALEGIELIRRLVENIIKDPTEPKKRTVTKTIPKIAATIFGLKGSVDQLFLAMGFMATDKDHFVFVGDYFKLLHKSLVLIDDAADPLRVQFMTPEEKKKWDILQEGKRIFKEEQRKKKEAIEHEKQMQKYDRLEKAAKAEEEIKDSIGHELKFGAHTVVFKPPVSKGG
jgi:uncharacterized protein (DUF2249 family)